MRGDPRDEARRRRFFSAVLAALAITLLNAAKPLVIDDSTYFQFARQIAAEPGDPYGFDILYFQMHLPAMEVLAPPVMLYWWAATQTLLGPDPVAWKLALFPFALLLAVSLSNLVARFAPGLESPLVWMILLSPWVVPGFNYMLDVPALALALGAFALLARSCDRERGVGTALLAGVLAGLAMQTKYTALIPVGAALAYGVLANHWRRAFLAGVIATLLFVGWEVFMASIYGESHFLVSWRVSKNYPAGTALVWCVALFSLVGASAPALGLLAMLALRLRRLVILGAAAVSTAAFFLIALLPAQRLARIDHMFPVPGQVPAETLVFLPLGLLVLASASEAIRRHVKELLRRRRVEGGREAQREVREVTLDLVLLLWVAAELIGFFALSWPALRRVIGLDTALAVCLGRLVVRFHPSGPPLARVRLVVAWGISLGLLFALTDLTDAVTRRGVVLEVDRRLVELGGGAEDETRWYIGQWGFEFYAEQHGMRPVALGESELREGDWLVTALALKRAGLPEESLRGVAVVNAVNPWPFSTIPFAYTGVAPIRPQPDAQLRVRVFRVLKNFVLGARRETLPRERDDPGPEQRVEEQADRH